MTASEQDVAGIRAAKQQAESAEAARRQAAASQVGAGGTLGEQPTLKLPPSKHDLYDQ